MEKKKNEKLSISYNVSINSVHEAVYGGQKQKIVL